MRNLIQKLHVYLIIKVNVKFSQFCTTKISWREVLVEFTHYHYIQEFLPKLCQGTTITLILRNLNQNQQVYKILKLNVKLVNFVQQKHFSEKF